MTTVSQKRLNEQRLRKLKYKNVKWVTVPSASYKFTPRYSESAKSSSRRSYRSEESDSSMRQSYESIPKTPYFKTSEVSFTDPELQILREADYTNTSPPIHKKSSQLEQLQAKKLENDKYLYSSALSSRSRIQLIPSLESDIDEIPRSDSVISFKPVELDDEDESTTTDPNLIQNRNSSNNAFNNSSVTIDDIKEHVWMWCHDNDDDELKKKVKHCNAQFIEQEISSPNPEQYQQQQQQLKYQFQQHRRQRQLIEKQKHHEQEQRQKQQQIQQQLQQQLSVDLQKNASINTIGSTFSVFDESFYSPENRLLEAHYNYSPGERRLRNIIKSHSKIEQDREEVKRRFNQKIIRNENTEKIESSYCAYKYQKYLFDKVGDVPDFLDDLDFTEAKKVKANLKKNRARAGNSNDDIKDDIILSQRTPRKMPK